MMGLLSLTDADPTVLTFTTEVRYLLGGIGEEEFPDTRVARCVQDAYDFVSQPYHDSKGGVFCHPELEFTEDVALAATQGQTTTAVWRRVYSVQHIDAVPASVTTTTSRRHLRWTDIALLDMESPTEGRPLRYAWWGNSFTLDSVPDTATAGQTLRVRGYREPPVLSTVTLIRREWDTIICKGAEYFGWMLRGETERAGFAKEEFARLINEQVQAQMASRLAPGGDPVMLDTGDPMRRS